LVAATHHPHDGRPYQHHGIDGHGRAAHEILYVLKLSDIPEIKVVLLKRPEVGAYGGGAEAANAQAARRSQRCSMTQRER
jgi:hypothetical protein